MTPYGVAGLKPNQFIDIASLKHIKVNMILMAKCKTVVTPVC